MSEDKKLGPAWQPLAFILLLIVQIIGYEAWAFKVDRKFTVTEGQRALAKKVKWYPVLVLLLTAFFGAHCFGKALGVMD